MDPTVFAMLIIKVGVPVAEFLLNKAQKGEPVTPEEWAGQKTRIQTPWDDIPAAPKA